ncbi:MAG: RhuM family protein [Patescibacteria group bacterium]
MKNKEIENKIVLFTNDTGEVELRADIEKDTLWATQAQIAELFEVNVPTINEHLKNIFRTKELNENSVIRKFRITAKDGKRYLTQFYNLDAILAVGYRVNSKKATTFRIWATKILREYLIKGYNLNQHQLMKSEQSVEGLHEAIAFMESNTNPGKLKGKITMKVTKTLIDQ